MASGELGIRRRARRRFYWLLARALLAVSAILPIAWGRALGSGLAATGRRLRPKERELARSNLALAFPELDQQARERLLEHSTAALGRNLFDFLAAERLLARPGFVSEEPVAGGSFERVMRELTARGRGVLILTGHLGCWELLGSWLARRLDEWGLGPFAVVTGTIHNEPVDRLVQDRRRRAGLLVLPRGEGIRPLLRHLHGGGVAAVLPDQNTSVHSLPARFFGRPAPTPTGLARISLRYGVPVLPVAIAAGGEGHVVRHLDPILPERRIDGKIDRAELIELLERCNAALEELVRRNPAEWVWFHRRWTGNGEDQRKAEAGA